MDLPALARAFNNLSRSPKLHSGLVDNHWHFVVRHVPLNPPVDLLHLANPTSYSQHIQGAAQILSCPSVTVQADVVLPLFLTSFVNTISQQPPAYAPRSEMASALEERLTSAGVRRELCNIKIGDKNHSNAEQENLGEIS